MSDPELAHYIAHAEAVRAVRALKHGSTVGLAGALGLGRELFEVFRQNAGLATTGGCAVL